jgi:hypothetical protein
MASKSNVYLFICYGFVRKLRPKRIPEIDPRSVLIGACLGARFGIQNIPVDWLLKVDNVEDLVSKAEKIFE